MLPRGTVSGYVRKDDIERLKSIIVLDYPWYTVGNIPTILVAISIIMAIPGFCKDHATRIGKRLRL